MEIKQKLHADEQSPIIIIQSIALVNGLPHCNYCVVGVLYKQLEDGSYLLVTCGHTFWEEWFPVAPNSKMMVLKDLYKENMEETLINFELLSDMKFGKSKHEDLAIINVRPTNPHSFKLFTPGKIDDSSKSEVNIIQIDDQGNPTQLTQTGYKKYHMDKFNFRGKNAALAVRGTPDAMSLLQLGAVRYPCYSIYSNNGASGSPIWNENYELLGINHGGKPGVWTSVATPDLIDNVIKQCGW